jgi:hypothetical protein
VISIITDCRFDPVIQAAQGRIVGGCADIIDYRIDQFAGRIRILLDLRTLLIEYAEPFGIAGFVGRL